MKAAWVISIVALSASGCEVTIPDGAYLCTDRDDCPTGFVCRTGADGGGACYRSSGDAGPGDSAPDTTRLDSSSDTPTDTRDAGDTAVCQPTEGCVGAAQGRDDDCNGLVDEGCAFTVGLVHSPVTVHTPARDAPGAFFGPELSLDGLRLYFAHGGTVGEPLYVAERPDLTAPFGQPRGISDALDLGFTVLSITGDEREVFVQSSDEGAGRILSARRPDTSASFTDFRVVAPTADPSGDQVHPTVSRDGRELYYVHKEGSSSEIRRVFRLDASAEFTSPWTRPFSDAQTRELPRLWEDGSTLVYANRTTMRTEWVRRDSPEAVFSPAAAEAFPGPDPGTHPNGVLYFLSNRARELWFTIEGPRTDAAVRSPMYRAQVCRDMTCVLPAPVECDESADDALAVDAVRCLHQPAATADSFADAVGACEAWGGTGPDVFVATIHTDADRNVLTRKMWSGYIGATRTGRGPYEWVTGEPLINPTWGMDEPNDAAAGVEECLFTTPGTALFSIQCDRAATAVLCVREKWPVFVP